VRRVIFGASNLLTANVAQALALGALFGLALEFRRVDNHGNLLPPDSDAWLDTFIFSRPQAVLYILAASALLLACGALVWAQLADARWTTQSHLSRAGQVSIAVLWVAVVAFMFAEAGIKLGRAYPASAALTGSTTFECYFARSKCAALRIFKPAVLLTLLAALQSGMLCVVAFGWQVRRSGSGSGSGAARRGVRTGGTRRR
jgi:hypothetical protein